MKKFDYNNDRCWDCGAKMLDESIRPFKLHCIDCMVSLDEEIYTGKATFIMKAQWVFRKITNYHRLVFQRAKFKKYKEQLERLSNAKNK